MNINLENIENDKNAFILFKLKNYTKEASSSNKSEILFWK